MAAVGSNSNKLSISSREELDNFEFSVKEKLKWTKKKWSEEGMQDSRMNKLTNSLHYWSKKLKPALERANVILTLFNPDRDVTVSLLDITDAIFALENKVEIVGFSDFRNPKYLSIYFESEEDKKYVESNLRRINDNFVVYLDWAKENDLKTVKIHWLTMTTKMEDIKQKLEKFFDFVEHNKETRTLMNGKILKSGKVKIRAKLKAGIEVADVPHLMYVGGLEALVTIQGRPPLCLTCDSLGHIARNCPTPFCNACRDLRVRGHSCGVGTVTRSYASVLKPKVLAAEFDEWANDEHLMQSSSDLLNGKIDNKEMTTKNLLNSFDVSDKAVISATDTAAIQDEDNDSVDRESDEAQSENEVLKIMEDYVKEINNMKSIKVWEEVPQPMAEVMADPLNLKRKLEDSVKVKASKQVGSAGGSRIDTGWVKSYGKSKNKNRKPKSRFLGESDEDREFIFKD